VIETGTQSFYHLIEPCTFQQLIQPLIERMPGRYRQLRMRDPDVFLLLPATSLAHSHARILRTFPVDLFSFCFTYPDLHHGLLTTRYGGLPSLPMTLLIDRDGKIAESHAGMVDKDAFENKIKALLHESAAK
jgi:hypothetical protein